MKIDKEEKRYMLMALAFSVVLFGIVIPYWLNHGFDTINPYLQFVIFNVAVFFILQVFFKHSILKRGKVLQGALGTTLLFLAIDILQPPYLVSTKGDFLMGAALSLSSSDYIAGLTWKYIGFTGAGLYVLTYIITPIILLIASSLLIRNFVKRL